MIQVGDLVRFSNDYLRLLHRRRNKNGKEFRRKNRIMKVIEIVYTNELQVGMDSRMGFNAVVRLDVTNAEVYGDMKYKDPKENIQISTGWLKFVRRKKPKLLVRGTYQRIYPGPYSAGWRQRVYPSDIMGQIVTVTPMDGSSKPIEIRVEQAMREEQAQRKVQRFAAPLGQRSLDL